MAIVRHPFSRCEAHAPFSDGVIVRLLNAQCLRLVSAPYGVLLAVVATVDR
jgi:hypothetical protein